MKVATMDGVNWDASNPRSSGSSELLEVPSPSGTRTGIHRAFRFPAKFHAPVVDALLARYTTMGQTVYDPFCGSGTLMIEAAACGRASIGSDVDPLATFVSRAKTRHHDVSDVRSAIEQLRDALPKLERPAEEYERLMHQDVTSAELDAAGAEGWIPAIPNLEHWFRRYVAVDLSRLRAAIEEVDCKEESREVLLLAFASVIRNSSNADPVPVSGLEVTSHMKRRDDLGRLVNPFKLFNNALTKTLSGLEQYLTSLPENAVEPIVFTADATESRIEAKVDAVITSPPYHNAVDYYRRHQLEMFWLGMTRTQADRLELLPKYIGRHRVPASHPMLKQTWDPSPTAKTWERMISQSSPARAQDFRVYMNSMARVLRNLARMLSPEAPAVIVVGRSSWNGSPIPTDQLFVELAADHFELGEHLEYPVKNRYMSYSRHNGADIDTEHVVVLRRKPRRSA